MSERKPSVESDPVPSDASARKTSAVSSASVASAPENQPATSVAPVAVVSDDNIAAVRAYLLGLQANIVSELERAGGEPFLTDDWTRAEGGGGISRLIEGAQLFERAGVLFSHVKGKTLPPSASAHRPELTGRPWEAMGVSMVLHPRNPYLPTTHSNVRMFVAKGPLGFWSSRCILVWWRHGSHPLLPL